MTGRPLPRLTACAVAVGASLALTACGGSPRPAAERDPSAASSETGGVRESPVPAPQPRRTAPTLRAPTEAEQASLDARLRAAAWANDVARARQLLARGADVNAKDETEQSAYLIATSEGYVDLLRLTLANGAKVNDKDSFNGTGLIRAAERGHHQVVEILLEAGIQRDHVNRLGYQAVHEAVWLGADTDRYVATIEALAAGGVELDRPSVREGLTPLQMAERLGHRRQAAALRRALDRR